MIAGAALWIAILWDRKTSTDHIGYVVDFFNVLLYGSPLRLALKASVNHGYGYGCAGLEPGVLRLSTGSFLCVVPASEESFEKYST